MSSTPELRDVSELLDWLEGATPGTLVPAVELAERILSLPQTLPPRDDENDIDNLLTADDVADWLACDRQRVYRMGRDGRLPVVRIGQNTVRFRPADVQAWIDGRRRS